MCAQVMPAAPLPPVPAEARLRLFHSARAMARRLRAGVRPRKTVGLFARGAHPLRRPGPGDSFWQYRPFESGEPVQMVDWRRSARSDRLYVREREWETSRALWLWIDGGAGMRFASKARLPSKEEYALFLGFLAAWLSWEAGEPVIWAPARRTAATSRATAARLLTLMAHEPAGGLDDLLTRPLPPAARLLVIGDGLWPQDALRRAIAAWRGSCAEPMVVEIADPAEEAFPWGGRLLLTDARGTDQRPRLLLEDGQRAAPAINRRLAAHRRTTEALLAEAGIAHLRLKTAQSREAAAALLAGLLLC